MKMFKFIIVGVLVICGMSCTERQAFTLEGDVEGMSEGKIYLYRTKNEYYGLLEAVDSAEIRQGHFKFERRVLRPELYFLGQADQEKRIGGSVFLEPGKMTAMGKVDEHGTCNWKIEGSRNQELYAQFQTERFIKSGQAQLDSMNNLFYAARDRKDLKEQIRIKEESGLLYDRAERVNRELAKEYINKYRDKAVALYLYRRYSYTAGVYNDTVTIRRTKDEVEEFGAEAKHTAYYDWLMKRLSLLDQCAVGRKVHEIVGVDTLGNTLKLSDFRGKYVLVDFWNSYCHWCREESPNMRRALAECGDRFTIFGVSNDMKKELWLEAIRKDEAHWNQVLVGEDVWQELCEWNCIVGIPHILLIDPEGIIVAKDVRGEDIIEVPKKFLGR